MSEVKINQKKSIYGTVIKAWLLVGTLDILSAFSYAYLKSGISPATILQYINKTAFRKTELDVSIWATVSGLLIHYGIALGWTIIFFILFRNIKAMRSQIIVTAILYGLFVWCMMNLLIVPVWAQKAFVLKPSSAIINAIILMFAIGLPLSVIAKKFYSKA